jgi:hypothetical protein
LVERQKKREGQQGASNSCWTGRIEATTFVSQYFLLITTHVFFASKRKTLVGSPLDCYGIGAKSCEARRQEDRGYDPAGECEPAPKSSAK